MSIDSLSITYQSLNPSTYFQHLVSSARSVILAGGTLSPVRLIFIRSIFYKLIKYKTAELIDQLFLNIPHRRLSQFSCSHIIPPSNLQAIIIDRGPRNSIFKFTHSNITNQDIVSKYLLSFKYKLGLIPRFS